MPHCIQDRNVFLSRFSIATEKRSIFEALVQELLVFAEPFYDRGCAFAFQGWGRDPNEWVAIASWDEVVVGELRKTPEFQRLNAGMLDCSSGPMLMENFAGMKVDRSIFEWYPEGTSHVHVPGISHVVVYR